MRSAFSIGVYDLSRRIHWKKDKRDDSTSYEHVVDSEKGWKSLNWSHSYLFLSYEGLR